ncbi:uncharacterized protein [Littorina saxatilis]|uniref:uncharacterized protein isoform X2 n=1 Tax=Littorina saxatilis TaxID=31220 RepID=UPI0038B4A452
MAKIMAANLGVTPSKWRKLFAHHNRHKTEQFRESVISKMNHTGDTHRRWYEGVAAKDTYLEVVKVAAGQGHGISAAEAQKEKELMRIRGELESYPEPSDTDEEDDLPPPLTKAELPEELKVIGFMLPTRHFMKKDYPHNKNSPWASPRLLPWLHYYLGGYRGNKNVGAKVIRACLRAMPKAKEELATKTVQNIRDKLRNWYL